MKKLIFALVIGVSLIQCNNCDCEQHDIVVIGGGLMGSSAAWHLSNYGEPVLLLEKQDSIYTQGSSYGEARIARSSNRGNDMWSYLHNRSVQEVEHLIQYLNSEEKEDSYEVKDIYTTSAVTYVGRSSIYDKLMASLIRQEVDYKIASTPEEGKSVFDVALPDSVLIQREYNKYSGTINPKVLIQYLHKAVRLKENEIRYNQTVNAITKGKCCYKINVTNNLTDKTKTICARKVVTAAGPYSGTLLKEIASYYDTLINPQRVFLSFLKVKDEKFEKLSEQQVQVLEKAYPVINSSTGTRDGSFFSMIEGYDGDNPIIKIGGHFQRSDISNMDKVWEKELSPEEIAWSKNGTARYFDLLQLPLQVDDLELVDGYSCVYSLSATEVPYVSARYDGSSDPDHTCITLGAMSGVGAKGAMTYGLIGANLLIGKTESDTQYQEVATALGYDRLLRDIIK